VVNLKKQSQSISYCVLRDAYCGKAVEKTKPICQMTNKHKSLCEKGLGGYAPVSRAPKQSQSKPIEGKMPSARAGETPATQNKANFVPRLSSVVRPLSSLVPHPSSRPSFVVWSGCWGGVGGFMSIFAVIIGFFSFLGRFLCAGKVFFVDVLKRTVIVAICSVFTPFFKRGKLGNGILQIDCFRRKHNDH
jgi:hypothetical protein